LPLFVIVTGAGRSGTSAVARVLHESGVSMGSHFEGPASWNATGFYEELSVVALNDKIYADCGLRAKGLLQRSAAKVRQFLRLPPAQDVLPAPSRAAIVAAGAKYAQQMRELAAQVPPGGGWKSTHMALTLEAWLPRLPEKPKLVICLRSPEDVSKSVEQAYGGGRSVGPEAVDRWRSQYERLLDLIQEYQLDAMCIEYDNLITQAAETVARLAEFVDHPLDQKYVEPSLRHHASEPAPEVRELYERVKTLGSA
jgi:hypothetical protein